MLNYRPGPVGEAFLRGTEFIKIIMGPVGGGKSTVALFELLKRSVEQTPFDNVRRTKHIVLRNTMQQLRSTVKPLLEQWFVTLTNGRMGVWKLTDNTFQVEFRMPDDTRVHSDFIMLPADTPDDVRRLLSVECSDAWCEEGREVDPEVFSGLAGRTNRWPNRAAGGVRYPGLIVSTNPPPIGGFWHGMISSPPKGVGVYIQPPALLDDGTINPAAENLANLAPDYYENLLTGKTEDWTNVYLRNQYGAGDMGRPIYRGSFKKSFHVSDSPLILIPQTSSKLVIGMDNGLQAAAAIMQRDARGRVNILGECFVGDDESMGVETFLDRRLIPLLRDKFPFHPNNIIFSLDPACFQRSQVDEKTIAQAVQQRGFVVAKASTNDPERRIQSVEGLMGMQVDGKPAFLIDPSCAHVIDTLEWGHRYKKTANGQNSMTIEKNHHSHMGDAIQYGALFFNAQADGYVYRQKVQRRAIVPASYRYT